MSMASAMERAGFSVAASRLRSLAHEALTKHHLNVERAFKTFEAAIGHDPAMRNELILSYLQHHADEMPADGRKAHASRPVCAVDGQPDPDGVGHTMVAIRPIAARPGREPSAADRAAASSVAKVLAITVLDTFKVRDGRAIGDVRYGELDRMRGANLLEASVIQQIKEHGVADHGARVRDIIKSSELQRMIQRAAEVSDAS